MSTAYNMSNKDAEEHLKSGGTFEAEGGTFEAEGGTLKVVYVAVLDRYVLANDTGNGMDYTQARYETIQDLMSQLAGNLSEWEAVGGTPGGG